AARARRVAVGDAERQRILHHLGEPADHGVAAYAAKLVHAHRGGYEGAVAHRDLARERRVVDQHHLAADAAVVPDVRADHQHAAAAHARQRARPRAAVDGDAFAENIAVADLDARYGVGAEL